MLRDKSTFFGRRGPEFSKSSSDAERDYGTSFAKEVEKLNGKPYYPPRQMLAPAYKPN